MSDLGAFIKQKRESSGLTQKQLGDAIGISDAEIQRIENGLRKTPNWKNLCKIAKALNFHPFEILLCAGYITESDFKATSLISGLDDLDDNELHTVQLFVNFIKTQRNQAKN
jgi:transcriptional regulator with XRE-family HTH domain